MVVNTLFWCQQYLRKTHHHLMYLLHLPLVLLHAEIATIWQTVWDMPCKGNDRQFTIPKLSYFLMDFSLSFFTSFWCSWRMFVCSTKVPRWYFRENLQDFFVMLFVIVILSSLEVFMFPGYFSMSPTHHFGFSQTRKCLLQLWALPWLLSIALFCQDFPSHFIASAAFLRGYFLSTGAFYLALLQYFFLHFVTRMRAGTPHLEPSSLSSLKELSRSVSAWSWTTDVWIE